MKIKKGLTGILASGLFLGSSLVGCETVHELDANIMKGLGVSKDYHEDGSIIGVPTSENKIQFFKKEEKSNYVNSLFFSSGNINGSERSEIKVGAGKEYIVGDNISLFYPVPLNCEEVNAQIYVLGERRRAEVARLWWKIMPRDKTVNINFQPSIPGRILVEYLGFNGNGKTSVETQEEFSIVMEAEK